MQKNYVPVFAPFFRKIPIRQNRLSQILMNPLLSILIFQPGLDFPAPEAIRDFFLSFQELTYLALFRHKLDIGKRSVLKTLKPIFRNGPGT